MALSNGHIVYKGYKPEPKKQLTRTMLMLHNKRTGKVRLIEAEQWQVSPVLQKPVIEENKNDVDENITILNKQFGSKKVKRRTERYEKMKIDVNSVKEQLEKTVSSKTFFIVYFFIIYCFLLLYIFKIIYNNCHYINIFINVNFFMNIKFVIYIHSLTHTRTQGESSLDQLLNSCTNFLPSEIDYR